MSDIRLVDGQISGRLSSDEQISGKLSPESQTLIGQLSLSSGGRPSIIDGVSDEFIISDEKILFVNEISVNKIDGIDEAILSALPGIATSQIPGLVLSSDSVNSVLVLSDGVMVVNDINVNKLVQTSGERFTLNGGSSTD